MPVFSTLGSLTYTKVYLGDQYYWYIETDNVASGLGYVSGNSIYYSVTGEISGVGFFPGFMNLVDSNFALPTDSYHAFYGNSSDVKGETIDIAASPTSNLIYHLSYQSINGNIQTSQSYVRTLNANTFALQNTYVDTPTSSTRTRIPQTIIPHANGTYTVAGQVKETDTVTRGYITNFTGNTKNWSKVLNPISLINSLTVTKANTFLATGTTTRAHIVEISGNGNSILKQINFSGMSNFPVFITIDSSDNIYYKISDGTKNNIGKIDNTGAIVWQKQIAGNLLTNSAMSINSITVGGGNVFVAGPGNVSTANAVRPLSFMSFDANSGNLNWQRIFYENNANFETLGGSIIYNNNNIYLSGSRVERPSNDQIGYSIRLPADGSIPGNGVYTGNLIYKSSNIAISTGNVSIALGNTVTISNAVSTAVTTSNIVANTANFYTLNTTRLS